MKNSIFEEEPVFLQNLIRFLVSPSLTSSGSGEEDFNFIQFEEVLNFSGGDTGSGGRAGAGRHAAVLHQHLQRGSPGKLQLLSDIIAKWSKLTLHYPIRPVCIYIELPRW